jgi:hypothetical protein
MRSQILKKRKELGDAAVRDKPSIGIILCYLLLIILFCQHYSFLPF